jgi:hypothetical protein
MLGTSQLLIDKWHDLTAVPTIAIAHLARLVHSAYTTAMKKDPEGWKVLPTEGSPARS